MTGRRTARALYALAMAVAVWAGTAWYGGGFLHDAWCLFARELPVEHAGQDRLLACSNVEQEIIGQSALRDAPTDNREWRVFERSGPLPGSLLVRARLTAPRFLFYPRFSGPGDRLVISQVIGKDRKILYDQRGPAPGWTPVGAIHELCVGCADQGWSRPGTPVDLEIVLEGGAQLWHKDAFIFF
ncbi:hypothetical protein NNJEOMEG_01656 [Fundidesulfovibrio magnetotacticus]|uniref:Uncharacterized protein n=1 Tax=Fundidesulfovibrio magnetotacticus TaxID=2730080 RepID=A0A6V8LS70_9BACT|nr:hypothetical protein [Fundidesulfovibrio magnetotacticus]GFK93820.1 hypothetical protein NNJEOMEG_01656 [Fundidesulfovibrio magnetotacticus]